MKCTCRYQLHVAEHKRSVHEGPDREYLAMVVGADILDSPTLEKCLVYRRTVGNDHPWLQSKAGRMALADPNLVGRALDPSYIPEAITTKTS